MINDIMSWCSNEASGSKASSQATNRFEELQVWGADWESFADPNCQLNAEAD